MYDEHPPLADKEWQAVVPLKRVNGAYLLNRSQGVQNWGPGGDRYEFLATGEKSGGTNFILLANIPVGGGPPPHTHKNETEAFILLSGALVFTIGTERFEASENSFVHIPQGVIHTYANTGVQPVKALVVFSPAADQTLSFRRGRHYDPSTNFLVTCSTGYRRTMIERFRSISVDCK
jgi:mannose-6-phosphate isomerase-like protein (cupin superfamily)